MADVKAYKPSTNSIGSGQVLQCPYPFEKARLVLREMADMLALDLVDRGFVTDQLVLTVGYDRVNLQSGDGRRNCGKGAEGRRADGGRPDGDRIGGAGTAYRGEITTDRYGRSVPKHAHGTENLGEYTASSRRILQAATELFERIVNPDLLVRRMYLTATHAVRESEAPEKDAFEQLDLFTDYQALDAKKEEEKQSLEKEKRWQKAMLDIKKKYGKNAILRGMNLEEGATARDRNNQIGGHRA